MRFLESSKRGTKRLLQRTLSWAGPERFHSRGDGNLLVLMYHRVLPDKHPDRHLEQPGMYVSPETFGMHMQILKSRFPIMRLTEWVSGARAGRKLPKFACAVTFDDGWRDNYDYAYPILRKYDIPATIFVVSGFVGTRYSFWPNRLMRLISAAPMEERKKLLQSKRGEWLKNIGLGFPLAETGALNKTQLNELVEKCKTIPEDELLQRLEGLESNRSETGSAGADMLDWEQLKTMQAGGLIDIGSHTCRHRRLLKGVSPAVIREEIEASKAEIQEKLNVPVIAFCYPNGDYTDDAVECVRRNYEVACTTSSGCNTQKSDLMRLKRIGVHEDISADRHAFLARLSGLV